MFKLSYFTNESLGSHIQVSFEHSYSPYDSFRDAYTLDLLQKVEFVMVCLYWQALSLEDGCGSTALGLLESEGVNGQIDWQAGQTSRLVHSLTRQRCGQA